MMKFKLNLKQKIILTNLIILTPIIIFMILITYHNLNKNLINNSVDYLLDKSKSTDIYISNLLSSNKNPNKEEVIKETSPFIATTLSEKFNIRIQLISNSAQVIYDSANDELSFFEEDINESLKGDTAYIIKKIGDTPYVFFSSPIFYEEKQCGVLRFILQNTENVEILNNTLAILGLSSLISLIVATLLINTFSKEITNPLIILKEQSKNISNGHFKEKLHITSGDEVEALANTFNQMSESLDTYITELKEAKIRQKNFFDNVSHEFKTPLTAIIGFSEIIPKLDDRNQILQCTNLIQKEGNRLLNLVEEILLLSKHNKENFSIEFTYINIKSLLDECLNILKIRLSNYEIEIIKNYDIFFTYGDYNKTKQVFINILDNAIKYSGCETIKITSVHHKEKIDVLIQDDGTGFIIKNNYKNSSKGNGLGLKICKDIMINQNGNFKIDSVLNEGTTITITFLKKDRLNE